MANHEVIGIPPRTVELRRLLDAALAAWDKEIQRDFPGAFDGALMIWGRQHAPDVHAKVLQGQDETDKLIADLADPAVLKDHLSIWGQSIKSLCRRYYEVKQAARSEGMR